MFLHMSMILFTGEGNLRPGGLCPRGFLSGGLCLGCLRGILVRGGVSVRETPQYDNMRAVRILLELFLLYFEKPSKYFAIGNYK